MKKFFNIFAIAVVAMATVSCNNTDDNEILGLDIDTVQSAISQTIDKFGDYDVNLVSEALTGKSWEIWSDIDYYEDWSGIRYICYYEGQFPTPPIPGWTFSEYEFTEDNGVKYNSSGYFIDDSPAPVEYTREGKWEFDPQSKKLTFNFDTLTTTNENIDTEKYRQYSISYILVAINNEMFIIDSVDYCNRRLYKTKE